MKFIKGFDGLRGISIILVLISHLGLYMHLPQTHFYQKRVWELFSGLTGVQIFFGLSGFLITSILLREIKTSNTINLKKFYLKRALRLFPALFIFYFFIVLCMKMGWMPLDKTGLEYAFFYIYNFIPRYYYSGQLGHLWSLAVEEQFYFLLPFLLIFVRKLDRLFTIFTILIAICFLSYFILPLIYFGKFPFGNYLDKYFLIDRWFIPASAPILIGGLAAILISKENKFKNLFYFKNKNKILVLCLILYTSPLYFPKFLLDGVSVFQAGSYVIFLCYIFYNQSGSLTEILSFKPLAYIGKISYGLYIYQGFFLRTGPYTQNAMKVQYFPINILLAFVVAIVSYEFIEKPILRYKKKFSVTVSRLNEAPIGKIYLANSESKRD